MTTYEIAGTVSCPVSAAVGKLRVSIVDKHVGGEIELTRTITNDLGAYSAGFDDAELKRRGKALPDLQTRVFAGEKFVGASEVRYNASPKETLDVVLDDSALPSLRSEHEALTDALATYYKGKLGALKETSAQPQITYLANKTGWDARAVALAVLADQFSAVSTAGAGGKRAARIRPEFYYALFRAGVPANASALYRVPADTVTAVWKQAIAQGIIPAALTGDVAGALATFQKLALQNVLDASPISGLASMGELLRLALGDDAARQQQFAALAIQHQGDLPAFWAAVGEAFGEQTTARLQLDGQIAALTLNNAQLMTKLYAAERAAPPASIVDLVRLGYYQPAKWSALLDGVAVGPMPGDSPAEQRDNYAALLAAQLRLSYPTAVLAEMIGAGAIPLTNNAALRAGVRQFLADHQGLYELGEQALDQYLADNHLTRDVDDAIVTQIKRLQRVYQITPNDQAMNALLQRDVDSAYQIVSYKRDAFVSTFQDAMGGAEVAARTFDNAQLVHDAVAAIATEYVMRRRAPMLGNGPIPYVRPVGPGKPAPPANAAASATLEKLFGSLDYCACEECRSVLGPASYLVGALNFTDCASPPAKSANPQDVLFERRPRHDPASPDYSPKKSVMPPAAKQVELFNKSVAASPNGQTIPARGAMDEAGNIHQFHASGPNNYHWAGQEAGMTKSGKPVDLDPGTVSYFKAIFFLSQDHVISHTTRGTVGATALLERSKLW